MGLRQGDLQAVRDANGKYGILHKNGTLVQPCIYDTAYWEYHLKPAFIVRKQGKLGLVDEEGKLVIPTEYDSVGLIDRFDYYHKRLRAFWVKRNDTQGIYDIKKGAFTPIEFDPYSSFVDDSLIVLHMPDGKRSLITTYGQVLIPPFYQRIDHSGLANALIVLKAGKYGVVTYKNQPVLPIVYDRLEWFKNGYALAQEYGKWGYIDSIGRILVPFQYSDIKKLANNVLLVKRGGKWFTIDTGNRMIDGCLYDSVANYGRLVSRNKLWGAIGPDGKQIMEPRFDEIRGSDPYKVRVNGKWALADDSGKLLTPAAYNEIKHIEKRIWVLTNQYSHQIITIYPYRVFPYQFDTISYDKPGAVGRNGLWTIISDSLTLLIPWKYTSPEAAIKALERIRLQQKEALLSDSGYTSAGKFRYGVTVVSNSIGLLGCINRNGKIVVPCKYNDIEIKSKRAVVARRDGTWTVFNRKGEIIKPADTVYNYSIRRFHFQEWPSGYRILLKKGDTIETGSWQNWFFHSKNALCIRRNDTVGVINRSGKIIIPFQYYERQYGMFCRYADESGKVEPEDKGPACYIVDKRGRLVLLDPSLSLTSGFADGLAPVENDKEKYGFVNRRGKLIIDGKYTHAWYFCKKTAIVQTYDSMQRKTLHGVINRHGHWKVKPTEQNILFYSRRYMQMGALGDVSAFFRTRDRKQLTPYMFKGPWLCGWSEKEISGYPERINNTWQYRNRRGKVFLTLPAQ